MYKILQEIDEKLILKFLDKHKVDNKDRYDKLTKYYEGKNNILDRVMMDGNDVNNKVANNYASYITDIITGYFIGKPVSYTATNNTSLIEHIQNIYNYNDEQDENNEIIKQVSIKGRCFEIVYLDKNDLDENNKPRIRFNKINAENMFAVYDYAISPEMSFAVRFYDIQKDDKKVQNVEVYTRDKIIFYEKDGNNLLKIDEVTHFFKIVPVVEYFNNEEVQGDFEKILSLIDAYDKACSDTINNLEYFANCYMYLVGMKSTDMDTIKQMKQMRVLLLDEAGEAGFLTKQENSTESENILNRLKNDIHKFAMVPDLSDENFASNQSGIAMMYKLFGLEQLSIKKERKMKKSLQRRLEIITNYLNVRGNNYNYNDIQLKFTRNIPVNDKENVEIVQMLQGIISKKTAISQLKMIDDVNAELDNIDKEKEEYSIDLGNIDSGDSDES